jgi:hypothetical protein
MLQRILKGILNTEDKNKSNYKNKALILIRRKDNYLRESRIELAAHTQILEQQKQLNGRNHHKPPNTNTEC